MENQALDLFTAQGGSKDHIFLGALGGTEAAVGSEFHTVVGDAWAQPEPPWPITQQPPSGGGETFTVLSNDHNKIGQ